MSCSKRTTAILAAIAALTPGLTGLAHAQDTSISYQGILTDTSGQRLTGQHDLIFQLYDDAAPGAPDTQIGPSIYITGAQITNGLFTAPLDFGAGAFDGTNRWLQISVDNEPMTPRQQVLSAPQANYARKPWEKATGGIQYGARVGIGTGTPAGALHVHTTGSDPVVDQQSHWNNFGTSTAANFAWQSFTAGQTGWLTRLDIGVYNNYAQGAVLRIYRGEGVSGQLLLDQPIWLNNGGWMAFWPSPVVPLVAGQVYTWYLQGNIGSGYYFDRRSSSYAAGRSSYSASDDYAFETWVTTSLPDDVIVDAVTGSVGIGTTSPTAKLDVEGDIKCVQLIETSSRSMKENVRPLSGALDTLSRLQGVTYRWKPELGGRQDIGFIAEDLGKVVPEVVKWETPGEKAAGIDYGHLTALAVEAIKEQQAQIAALKRENAAIRKELDELRKAR